ncbi:MAG: hypothetical protein AAFU55_05485 [Pseudomonadota bacterium]
MRSFFRAITRVLAAVLLLWANAFFAVAGVGGQQGDGAFADGYVICTPNGLITLSPDDVAALFGEEGAPPADVILFPICPDCVLGAASTAPTTPTGAGFALSEAIVRYEAPSAAAEVAARAGAYRSRAPPAFSFA